MNYKSSPAPLHVAQSQQLSIRSQTDLICSQRDALAWPLLCSLHLDAMASEQECSCLYTQVAELPELCTGFIGRFFQNFLWTPTCQSGHLLRVFILSTCSPVEALLPHLSE